MTVHTLSVRQKAAKTHILCRNCGSLPTKSCKNGSVTVEPHPERLSDVDLWFAGYDYIVTGLLARTQTELTQAEADHVEALQELTLAQTTLLETNERLADTQADLAIARTDLTEANSDLEAAELAAANAETKFQQADTRARAAESSLSEAVDDIEGLRAELATRDRQLSDQMVQVELLTQSLNHAYAVVLADAVAEIARLQAIIDAGEPTPPAPYKLLFGACPNYNGGSSNKTEADQLRVYTKFGSKPVTVRQFLATEVAPRADRAKIIRVHISWNLSGMTLANLTAQWVTDRCVNLLPNDRVEVIHEADKKVTDGNRTFQECLDFKNKFYDLVKQVRPDLKVVNTLTGGALSSYGGDSEERWGAVKADLLGVDCDGVHDTQAPLNISYRDEIVAADAFVKKYAANGYKGIVVPEFGTSRPPYDSNGNIRADWVDECVEIFEEFKIEEANLYDYESTPRNEFLPGTPEFARWSGFIAAAV